MSKHTPGPWKIFDDHPDPDLQCLHVCHGDEQIADVSELKNAHLIAAAPDLLEALDDIIGMAQAGRMVHVINRAKAASAKARG